MNKQYSRNFVHLKYWRWLLKTRVASTHWYFARRKFHLNNSLYQILWDKENYFQNHKFKKYLWLVSYNSWTEMQISETFTVQGAFNIEKVWHIHKYIFVNVDRRRELPKWDNTFGVKTPIIINYVKKRVDQYAAPWSSTIDRMYCLRRKILFYQTPLSSAD